MPLSGDAGVRGGGVGGADLDIRPHCRSFVLVLGLLPGRRRRDGWLLADSHTVCTLVGTVSVRMLKTLDN